MTKQELIQLISTKERELLNLSSRLEDIESKEKESVMKTKGFNKVLYLLNQEFQSSSERTPQYLEFHRTFKREFKNVLKPFCSQIDISKPNHFDVSGFFQLHSGEIYYFSLGDLRWDKEDMLIRTAKGFKDYTGGSNGSIKIDDKFVERIKDYLKIPKFSFTETGIL